MLHYAQIDWREEGTPVSSAFGDVYYSRGHAREETEYVFLTGNRLPERWNMPGYFTIAETGFGTGLNFLHSWQRFMATAPAQARLHFISVEAFPLSPRDLARALAGWDGPEAAQLQAQYPLPVPGWHRLDFGRVSLTLGFGDAAALLGDFDASVDAWFLDGFAPAKNASMWTEPLFDAITRLSHEGTRIASFTAAGHVRRALGERGWEIARRKGFGNKRHAIEGILTLALPARGIRAPEDAIVIGAGIAGASTARALAKRGVNVTLLDAAGEVADGASGNPAGVLYPHITQTFGANMAWHLAGFAQAVRMLHATPYAARTGMLKTPKDAKDEARLRNACTLFEADIVRWAEPDEAQEYIDQTPPSGGAWFPASGWVRPKEWCADLLQHERIAAHYHAKVTQLEYTNGEWYVQTATGTGYHSAMLVLACAYETERVMDALAGSMFQTAGQVSIVPAQDILRPLRAVLCHSGYMIPHAAGMLIGATYDHHDLSCAVTESNHAKNAHDALHALPGSLTPQQAWQGRTALRAATRDRMPLVGRLAEGLYVNAGHASRGLVSAPLAADCIASWMSGDAAPVSRTLAQSLSPLRRLRRA